MSKILYYPYINVPRTDWSLRALLYYESIGSIVPQEYFYNPKESYDPFMLELIKEELVIPINPMNVVDHPWEIARPFLRYIEQNRNRIVQLQRQFSRNANSLINGQKFHTDKIHAHKFDESIFHNLEELGLAQRMQGNWYSVERRTASQLMKYLATIISSKLQMLPVTDYINTRAIARTRGSNISSKRHRILERLIPFPENVDLNKLKKFKNAHLTLLELFKNRVEQIALDPNIVEGTGTFEDRLRELEIHRDELSAKMNEGKMGSILFGTVCGVIGAVQGLAAAQATGAILGALPGFANAIHSALKIERAEDTFDQTGLKYLALADKRLGFSMKSVCEKSTEI